MNYIILENIRSAYNVGNIIRTADALGRGVVISGYTPHPARNPRVSKSALGAEQNVPIVDFGITPDDPKRPWHLVVPPPNEEKKKQFLKRFAATKTVAEENQEKIEEKMLIQSISSFIDTQPAIDWAKRNNYLLIGAEHTSISIPLEHFTSTIIKNIVFPKKICVLVGNEVMGVKETTIKQVDYVVHIPMKGIKTSLNVGQASAILMRELSKYFKDA